jgi:hypothetical protein
MPLRWKMRLALRVLLACTLLGASTGAVAARTATPIVVVAPVALVTTSGTARARSDGQDAAWVRPQAPVAAAPSLTGRRTLAAAVAARWAVALTPRASTRPLYLLRQALLR